MSTKPTILITSAAGGQASHLIPLLIPHYNLRFVTLSTTSFNRLKSTYPQPTVEIIQADLTSPTQCASLLPGVSIIYHIGPGLHVHETQIGYNMIDAAIASLTNNPNPTFQHFILSSVLHTQIRKMLNHDCKRYIEEYLIESPLNWTILQPSDFLDYTFQLSRFYGVENPVWHSHLAPHAVSSMTALCDLAEAAARVIEGGPKHYFATYPLCSTPPIAYGEVVKVLSKAVGKEVEVKAYNVEEAASLLMAIVFKGEDVEGVKERRLERDRAERLTMWYSRRGLRGNNNVMRWLLGREPVGVEEWFEGEKKKLEEGKKA